MVIGIDASRAFLKRRTGIEEYAYQVIRHLRTECSEEEVVLYIRSDQEVSFDIPASWRVKKLWSPRLWTQGRLSLEMLLHRPGVLFVPAHTVPIIHPKKTIVTVHGLEYEFCPKAYSFWERVYMRVSIWFSSHVASRVIAVSENTRKDLIELYNVRPEKITVISEGYEGSHETSEFFSKEESAKKNPYLLFIGRLEERKNVKRILEAFNLLKERSSIPHRLVLVGKPGYGYKDIQTVLSGLKQKDLIEERGYVSEEEKWKLLSGADAFVFPTLYEGFGIPVLEAQSVGVPVVTSNISSLPEVGGEGAVYVDPFDVESIADGIKKVLSEPDFRSDIIQKATKNLDRFGWGRCAREIKDILLA